MSLFHLWRETSFWTLGHEALPDGVIRDGWPSGTISNLHTRSLELNHSDHIPYHVSDQEAFLKIAWFGRIVSSKKSSGCFNPSVLECWRPGIYTQEPAAEGFLQPSPDGCLRPLFGNLPWGPPELKFKFNKIALSTNVDAPKYKLEIDLLLLFWNIDCRLVTES